MSDEKDAARYRFLRAQIGVVGPQASVLWWQGDRPLLPNRWANVGSTAELDRLVDAAIASATDSSPVCPYCGYAVSAHALGIEACPARATSVRGERQ